MSKAAVAVAVQDSGIGIPPGFREKLFQPFQQASVRSTREFGGLGLGLAIVRQIVEMHHGTVTMESEGEGKGSTFIVPLDALQRSTQTVRARIALALLTIQRMVLWKNHAQSIPTNARHDADDQRRPCGLCCFPAPAVSLR